MDKTAPATISPTPAPAPPPSTRLSSFNSKLRSLPRRDLVRLVLRLSTLFTSIITIALFTAATTKQLDKYTDGDGYSFYSMAFGVLATTIVLTLILLLLSIFLPAAKYHPAMPLTFELVSWCMLISTGVLEVMWAVGGYYKSICTYLEPLNTGQCETFVASLTAINSAGCAFMLMSGILHFVLFVLACMDTHRLRMEVKERKRGSKDWIEMS